MNTLSYLYSTKHWFSPSREHNPDSFWATPVTSFGVFLSIQLQVLGYVVRSGLCAQDSVARNTHARFFPVLSYIFGFAVAHLFLKGFWLQVVKDQTFSLLGSKRSCFCADIFYEIMSNFSEVLLWLNSFAEPTNLATFTRVRFSFSFLVWVNEIETYGNSALFVS